MAKNIAKPLAGLGGKLQKALKAHKDEESTQEDFGNLPAGIEGGIAQIFDCKIDNYKDGKLKGKPYFSARASVVAPEFFTDEHGVKRKIKGLHTKIGPEPLCDTLDRKGDKARRTLDDHVNWVLKQLRTLGVDTSEIEEDDDLQAAIDSVKEDEPYITFRTWRGKATKQFPDPRTNEVWLGLYDYDEEEEDEDDDEVEDKTSRKKKAKAEEEEPDDDDDDTDDDEDEDEEPVAKSKKGGKKDKKAVKGKEDEDEDTDEADDEEEDEAFDDGAENLEELAEEADGGDKEAKRKLLDMAADKDVRKVKGMTFADLVEKLEAEDEEDDEEDEEEEEKPKAKGKKGKKKPVDDEDDDEEDESEDDDEESEWEPQEDEAYAYLPDDKDPKTGKAYKKPIQVMVLKVDKKKKTVDLMDNKTKRKFTKVKWLDLQQSED